MRIHQIGSLTRSGIILLGLITGECSRLAASNPADLTLDELLNVTVTSVSKKEQKLGDTAAAVFVITPEDLAHSGATTIADALRIVPGLQVASIDSDNWAVSARGFNSQYANKLLVMIDGRTVYAPLFSGVYWDVQQVFLADVDRVEVIRGPGATVWGANAVNGVISIMSKSARETQGGLIYGGGGDFHQALGGARYGDRLGENTYFRVYGTYQLNNDFRQGNGQFANDTWDLGKGGLRLDHYTRAGGHFTCQGDAYAGNINRRTGDVTGFNALTRWTQSISDRSSYEAQAYVDHIFRNDTFSERAEDSADLSFQHTFGLGHRNDVVWGLGYRRTESRLDHANSPVLTILDHDLPLDLYSMFAQDEFKILPDRLTFTLGAKLEHNDFTGFEFQPSARLLFKPDESQTLWASVSRAVRTPSIVEAKAFAYFAAGTPIPGPGGGPYLPTYANNPNVEAEVLWAYEAGYRLQLRQNFSLDTTVFFNDYDHLVGRVPGNFVPGVPVGTFELLPANTIRATSYGFETAFTLHATENWKLTASYSLLMLDVDGESAYDIQPLAWNAPTHQAILRSSYDFSHHVTASAQLRYVDAVQLIPSYVTADVSISWLPTANVELAIVGQNLLDRSHPEQINLTGAPTYEVPRGIYGKVTCKF